MRTLNKERWQRGTFVLRGMMNQANFLVPLGLEEHLKGSPDGTSVHQFWRALALEEKLLLKGKHLAILGLLY